MTFLLLSISPLAIQAQQPVSNEVIIIKGFSGHWARCTEFRDKLKQRGFESTVIWCYQRRRLCNDVVGDILSGRRLPPAAIIGFSLGATNGQTMAREMDRAGIELPLLILLDGPTLPTIPPNVHVCLHYYRPNLVERVLPTAIVGSRLLSIEGRPTIARRGMQLQPLNSNTLVKNIELGYRSGMAGLLDRHATLPGDETVQLQLARSVSRVRSQHMALELGSILDSYAADDQDAFADEGLISDDSGNNDSESKVRHAGFHFDTPPDTRLR